MRPTSEDPLDQTSIEGNAGPVLNNRNHFSDSPGKLIWIITIILSLMALAMGFYVLSMLHGMVEDVRDARDAIRDAALAQAAADKAERSAALSREYAVSAFFQTQVEWAKRGVTIYSPLEEHPPIPEEAYTEHDEYVEAEQ